MQKSEFLTKLKINFSDSELRDICLELDVDYEDIPGMSKADKARELILYLGRRARLSELLAICQQHRPHIVWFSSDSVLTINPKESLNSIEVQISNLSRRIGKLQEIKATKGIDTEPHYLIEIEDLQNKLDKLLERRGNT